MPSAALPIASVPFFSPAMSTVLRKVPLPAERDYYFILRPHVATIRSLVLPPPSVASSSSLLPPTPHSMRSPACASLSNAELKRQLMTIHHALVSSLDLSLPFSQLLIFLSFQDAHFAKDSSSPSDPNVKLFVTSFLRAAGYLQDPFVPEGWGTRWYRRDKAHLARNNVRPSSISFPFS